MRGDLAGRPKQLDGQLLVMSKQVGHISSTLCKLGGGLRATTSTVSICSRTSRIYAIRILCQALLDILVWSRS